LIAFLNWRVNMLEQHGGPNKTLEPDREQLATFIKTTFKHATPGTWVTPRAFSSDKSIIEWVKVTPDLKSVVVKALSVARRAANSKVVFGFSPPLATFSNSKHAREEDLAEGLVLNVECDAHPAKARATLEALLGPATCVVESGGLWTNPDTSKSEPKLHLHWRLSKPTKAVEEHVQLKLARKLAAIIAGGDISNAPIVHPIRWPGSWHRKAAPKLVRIVGGDHDREIDLAVALELLQQAAPPEAVQETAGRSKSSGEPANVFASYSDARRSDYQKLNDEALRNLHLWVLTLFPTAKPYHDGGYRVRSKALERDLQEDISFTREGIKDFGVHDLDDPLQGKRTPVHIVMEHLFNVPVKNIATRSNENEFNKAVAWLHQQLGHATADETHPPPNKSKLLLSSAEFVGGFVPPDYLIDGWLQRRYVYSVTGPTGAGKTCIVLRIAAHVALGLTLATRDVEPGRVLYLAGENPDDVRARWIKLCEEMGLDPESLNVFFIDGIVRLSDEAIRAKINAETDAHGPFALIIVDTSAAYFEGDDENSNTQLGSHARMLRTFTNISGGPTILITCHPVKNFDPDNLLPRGGGAFLNEVDGNLACVKDVNSMIVELTTHGKFRGPEFAPIAFQLTTGTSDKLVDSKGRSIITITAAPITSEEANIIESRGHDRLDELLKLMHKYPSYSLTELATRMSASVIDGGQPSKQKVARMMKALEKDKLATKRRGQWVLTPKGTKEAEAISAVKVVAVNDKPKAATFEVINSMKVPFGCKCSHCHQGGGALKFYKGTQDGQEVLSTILHPKCAELHFDDPSRPATTDLMRERDNR
jgi:hypothetical protein